MAATVLLAARAAAAALEPPRSEINEAMSGIFGSISLTAWICLLLPQLIANYRAKSADGLSMAFLFVWLLGDVANLTGALTTGLAPTAIALACYFCVADVILIAQCMYYNAMKARRSSRSRHSRRRGSSVGAPPPALSAGARDVEPDEEEPLLARRRSSSIGLPGSHRRHSALHRDVSNLDPLTRIITGEDETPDRNPWLHNALSLLAVYAVGTAGWFLSYRMGAWDASVPSDPAPGDGGDLAQDPKVAFGLIMGYFSALCYLLARIPQIVKNYQEKSCEGLALLFFLLSLTGNATYGLSLVAYSQEKSYLIKAVPWLLGSLGTIVEDCIIFVQFRLYAPDRRRKDNHQRA